MLITIPVMLGLSFVGVIAVFYVFQARLLFLPSAKIYRTPADQGWEFYDFRLAVGEETTAGWYVPTEGARRGVLLFSHGNAGNIADRIESISLYRKLGLDVVAYDYGGYGASTGSASEERCYEDIRAVWKYLVDERGIAPSEIVLFGRSLGSGPTSELALEVDAAGLILESAFRSVPEMGADLYPWLPVRTLARIRFDNESKMSRIQTPVLIVHSPDDSLIPYAHGRKLYEAANDPKDFLDIAGDHNDGFWMSGAMYTDGFEAFLDRVLRRQD